MRKKPETLFDRIHLPTRVIVNRFELSAADLSATIEKGEQILVRGKIVRRRRGFVFKVLETAEEESR